MQAGVTQGVSTFISQVVTIVPSYYVQSRSQTTFFFYIGDGEMVWCRISIGHLVLETPRFWESLIDVGK